MKDVTPPKGEISWVGYYNTDGEPVCILTSKPARDYYFLYEVLPDGKLNKLGKAKPLQSWRRSSAFTRGCAVSLEIEGLFGKESLKKYNFYDKIYRKARWKYGQSRV